MIYKFRLRHVILRFPSAHLADVEPRGFVIHDAPEDVLVSIPDTLFLLPLLILVVI